MACFLLLSKQWLYYLISMIRLVGSGAGTLVSPEITFPDPGNVAFQLATFNHNLGTIEYDVTVQYTANGGTSWRIFPTFFNSGSSNRGWASANNDGITENSAGVHLYRIVAFTTDIRILVHPF